MDFNWPSGNGIYPQFTFMTFMLTEVASLMLNKKDKLLVAFKILWTEKE